ncbi:unnamed protein product, partial [Didymodactylos carnosus]
FNPKLINFGDDEGDKKREKGNWGGNPNPIPEMSYYLIYKLINQLLKNEFPDKGCPKQSQARQAADAKSHQQRRQMETPEQSQTRRAAAAEGQRLVQERRSHQSREEAIHFKENRVVAHNCGPMNEICQLCRSRNFKAERP